ncbi:unnamed protein product [Cunninghamella blakesleeana]
MAFSFGQAPAAQPTNAFGTTGTTGFSFGGGGAQPNTSTFTPSLFGGATTQPTTATGGFGFINTNTNTNTNSLFGAKPLTNAFSTNPTNPTPTTTNLFGTTPSGTTNNLFGGGGFGKPTSTTTSTSLFGAQANKPLGTFGGGGGLPSSFGTNTQGMNNLTPQQRDKMIWDLLSQKELEERQKKGSLARTDMIPENIWQALALMKSWWDPQSPNCKFKTYFYNLVAPQEVHLYQRPQNHDQKAWEDAQKKNPDPSCMVPVLAVGFTDIEKRMEIQKLTSEAHKVKLDELDQRMKKIQTVNIQENLIKLNEAKRQYMELVQRVIKFLKHTQVLRHKGLSITHEEEVMRTSFETIQDQLQRSEQIRGTFSQMWAQLQLIKESGRKYGSIDGIDNWDSVSSSHVEEITKILNEQERGIHHIIDVVQNDLKQVENMQQIHHHHHHHHQNNHTRYL